jgi:hypothetical protein
MDYYTVELAQKAWIAIVEQIKELQKEEQAAFEAYQAIKRDWEDAR